MPGNDLVDPLKAAIRRADPSWITQPSHLRRRLDEELGQDARAYRAQVHQLVVAAEERIPIRLRRDGGSQAAQVELVNLLVGARGWTVPASEWAVATWAAALDLSDERPVSTPSQPTTPPRARFDMGNADPTDRGLPSAPAVPTVLPSEMEVAAPPSFPLEIAAEDTASPSQDQRGAEIVTNTSAVLPSRGMRGTTKKAAQFLERELDVAYQVKVGTSPAWLFLLLVGSVGIFVATGFVPLMFILAFSIAWTVWPSRILAVSGDRVWLLGTTRFAAKPTEVISHTDRDLIAFAGGWPMSSVRLDGQRLWLPLPVFGAARCLPTGTAEVST